MIEIRFTIQGRPVHLMRPRINFPVVVGWLKRGRRGKPGPLVYTPRESINWQKTVAALAKTAIMVKGIDRPLTYPIALAMTFYIKKPGSMSKFGLRPDIDNYAKNVMDALNGVAFEDDAFVDLMIAKRVFVDDKILERTEIIIQHGL